MYQPAYILSPFSVAKRKMSDNAKRLAFTQLAILIIDIIVYSVIISLFFQLLNIEDYNQFIDFILEATISAFWILPLEIGKFLLLIVNYIFFFLFASSFTALGRSDSRIDNIGRRTTNMLVVGIILSIIGALLWFFNLLVNNIIALIGTTLLVYGFYNVMETFKELRSLNLYARKENRLLLFSQIFQCASYILLTIGFYQNLLAGIYLIMIHLIASICAGTLFVVGLFKLSNDANDIVDPNPHIQAPVVVHQAPAVYVPPPTQQQIYVKYPEQAPQPVYQEPQPKKDTGKTMFCSNCGVKVTEKDRFCKECGNEL